MAFVVHFSEVGVLFQRAFGFQKLTKGSYIMYKYLAILLSVIFLTGCATSSGYTQFYEPIYTQDEILLAAQKQELVLLKDGESPKVYSIASSQLMDAHLDLLSEGYILIGQAHFNGSLENESGLVSQARKASATVVLTTNQFSGTRTSVIPFTVPTTSTTTTNVNVYGSSGYAFGSGTSTTTGSSTVPITTHQDRYDQSALYYVKDNRKPKLGLIVQNLTNEQRKVLQQNTGVFVYVVMKSTPAFRNNILNGDFLISMNDISIDDQSKFFEVLDAIPTNSNISLKLIRNGKPISMIIKLQ